MNKSNKLKIRLPNTIKARISYLIIFLF